MSTLYLSWQNAATRRWFVVGKLSETATGYTFRYTRGALDARRHGFRELAGLPELRDVYEAHDLFAVFQNRIKPTSRPEYDKYLSWLALSAEEASPLVILERTGGLRQTDALELFRVPETDAAGNRSGLFFLRGVSHRAPVVQEFVMNCSPGDRFYLAPDSQNPHDPEAVLVRSPEEIFGIGYLPRYLAPMALRLLTDRPHAIDVKVERVNDPPAPLQLRMLCRFTVQNPPSGFEPFQGKMFEEVEVELDASKA